MTRSSGHQTEVSWKRSDKIAFNDAIVIHYQETFSPQFIASISTFLQYSVNILQRHAAHLFPAFISNTGFKAFSSIVVDVGGGGGQLILCFAFKCKTSAKARPLPPFVNVVAVFFSVLYWGGGGGQTPQRENKLCGVEARGLPFII